MTTTSTTSTTSTYIFGKTPREHLASAGDFLVHMVPLREYLQKYSVRNYLLLDLVAGFTVAMTTIPQGLAYAAIAGIPEQYGLYTAAFAPMAYLIFGTSKDLSVGPSPVMASLLAQIFMSEDFSSSDYSSMADYCDRVAMMLVTITFWTAIIQLGLFLINAGFVMELISNPVISGFTSGAALTIALGQVDALCGFKLEVYSRSFVVNFVNLIKEFASDDFKMNWWALLMGCTGIVILELLKQFKIFGKYHKFFPRQAFVLILGTLITYLFNLGEVAGIPLVPKMENGFASPLKPDFEETGEVITISILLAILGIVTNVAIARSFAKKEKPIVAYRANQEFFAQGFANLFASFFITMASSGSFSRSSVQNSAYARTTLVNLVVASLVTIVISFLMFLFEYTPKCVLAAIIIQAVLGMIEYDLAKDVYRKNKVDFAVLVATFFLVLVLGLEIGIILGFIVSVIVFFYQSSRPRVVMLAQNRNTLQFVEHGTDPYAAPLDDVIVIRVESEIKFPNANFIKDEIARLQGLYSGTRQREMKHSANDSNADEESTAAGVLGSDLNGDVDADHSNIAIFILDGSRMHDLDYEGVQTIAEIAETEKQKGRILYLAELSSRAREALEIAGFYTKFPTVIVFPTLASAAEEAARIVDASRLQQTYEPSLN